MKRLIATITATAILACPLFAHATDPLWAKVSAQNKELKNWIAQDMETQLDSNSGDRKHIKMVSHLSGFEKDKPVYQVVSIDPPPAKGKASKEAPNFDSFTAIGSALLADDAPVKRLEDQTLNGKKWAVIEIADSKMGTKVSSRLWVEPESGALHQTELTMRIPLMIAMSIVTKYTSHPTAGVVAEQMEMQGERLTPFTGEKFHVLTRPTNWIARPH